MATATEPDKAPVDPFLGEEPALPAPEESPVETAPEPPAEPPAEPTEPEEPVEPEETTAPAEPAEPAPAKKPGPWSRLRQLEDERAEYQRRFDTMQQEIERLKAPPPPPSEQTKPLTYEEDPLEYLRQQQAQIAQAALQTQQQNQTIMLQNQIRMQEEEFSREHADYRDALRYLEDREMRKAKTLGYDDERARQIVAARARLLVDAALSNGKTVPELAWQVAIEEGWKTPAPAEPAAPAAKPVDKIAASKARSAISQTSVGGVAGGPSTNKPVRSRQELLDLSEKEIERLDREDPGWETRLEA